MMVWDEFKVQVSTRVGNKSGEEGKWVTTHKAHNKNIKCFIGRE